MNVCAAVMVTSLNFT